MCRGGGDRANVRVLAMKPTAIVLSAGVVAGLCVYAVLTWCNALGILMGDVMTLRIPVFVATLAGVGFGSGGLTLLFRSLFEKADGAQLRALEARLATLEQAPPR